MKNSPTKKSDASSLNNNEDRLNISYSIPVEKLIIIIIIITAILISLAVITSWFFGYEKILSIIPGSATMKFNSALVFLFAGINLLLFNREEKVLRIVYKTLAYISILIGLITILKHLGIFIIDIDNIFVEDTFSIKNHGMMSPATAICSI